MLERNIFGAKDAGQASGHAERSRSWFKNTSRLADEQTGAVSLSRTSAAVAWLLLVVPVFISSRNLSGASAHDQKAEHWAGTWACSPQLADLSSEPPAPGFADVTLRQIVHVSIGGPKIRVRFSSAFGKSALTIFSAHVAKAAGGSAIKAGTDKPLTFDERSSVTIPAGALVYSDPLAFDLLPLSDLAVTIYLKNAPDDVTTHSGSRATSYFTSADAVSLIDLPSAQIADHWYLLNGVDVAGPNSSAAVVILGDSINDGKNSTNLSREADSGDHLHPADGGYRIMGDAIDLKLFAR